MKALKVVGMVLGGLLGLVLLAALVFWLGWMRGPSPEEVCAHMGDLSQKETGRASTPAAFSGCVTKMQPPQYGKMHYVAQMKCALAAGTMKEVADCEKRR